MKDFEKVLELDPGCAEANMAVRVRDWKDTSKALINFIFLVFQRLPEKIQKKDEEIKKEMFGKFLDCLSCRTFTFT